jgi:hypothetical protein
MIWGTGLSYGKEYECARKRKQDLPLGWVNSPFSTPDLIALLNWASKALWEAKVILLFADTYFLMAWRLK